MAFWTSGLTEPLRKFRFQIQIGNDSVVYWAKSVTQPSFEISTNEYLLVNHKFKYPGVVTWSDIDIVLVEIQKEDGTTIGLNSFNDLVASGYYPAEAGVDGIIKEQFTGSPVIITKLKSDGAPVETWTLFGAFVKAVKYGDLDYSSDELLDITISLSYDRAELSKEEDT